MVVETGATVPVDVFFVPLEQKQYHMQLM